MLRIALAAALLLSCSEDKAPPPPPTPTRTAPPPPAVDAPACAAVAAGLDIAALCGAPFQLVITGRPDRCSLVPGPDSAREHMVRIDIERASTRRLPASHPASGWSRERGRTARARRGAFPWLIDARSRGPETALCSGAELAAVTARVAALLPGEPALPPNAACDAIFADIACGIEREAMVVGELEGVGDHICRRYSRDRGLTFSITRGAPPDEATGKPVTDARGNVAVIGAAGDYTVELRSNRAVGSGQRPCSPEQLARLFRGIKRRTAATLKK